MVSTTIQRNFDWRRGPFLFRRRFSAISIGGEDNGGFDDDLAQFRSAARTSVVSTTIGAISIGGEDKCGFDDELAQFRSAARTMAVSTTIQRNFDPRQGPPISRGKIVIFMYSINSICYSPYLLICIYISLDQGWGD